MQSKSTYNNNLLKKESKKQEEKSIFRDNSFHSLIAKDNLYESYNNEYNQKQF